MSNMIPYTYTILRYVHDITTGEFVNVGVAIYAPQARYASALCRPTYGRLNKVFPGINADYFKSLMRHIQARFEEMGEQISSQLALERIESVEDLAHKILPSDDSSLQWSTAGAGKTTNPAETLERLFERMVMRYEDRSVRERRTEDDVWRHFKRDLEARQLLQYFEPSKIAVRDDEIDFQYTWKNGVLHCLEPVSFDLSSPESIRDKAHRWLGRITSVANAQEKFRMYFLVGRPQEEELISAYESAISILGKIPVDKVIYSEQQADELGDLLAREVAEHMEATRLQ
ncbi:MAG TPA: DUF3037 domain-containing protein [Gammaproteobacteria bacterium]